MVFKTDELIDELTAYVNSHIQYAEKLKEFEEEELLKKKNKKSWSAIECLEHLNLYAQFYNIEIRRRVDNSKYSKSAVFKSGYLGNKSAVSMLPKKDMDTMNTFKSKNPIYSELNVTTVLNKFIKLQKELGELLEKSKEVDLTKTKTAITLPLLKFRLGDTLRFVIYHNERHIQQAKKALK